MKLSPVRIVIPTCLKRIRRIAPIFPVLLLGACTPARPSVTTGPRVQPRQATPRPRPVAPTPVSGNPWNEIRKIEVGRSVNGTPLTMEIFGDGPERIFIFGGIHGNEPTSAYVAHELANHLRINWHLFEGKTVAILAEANPDGLRRGTRGNARGVDLNRNFPARNWRGGGKGKTTFGPAPASEPETRALLHALDMIQPQRIVSIHSIAGVGRHCNNYDGPAVGLARLMAEHNGYPVTPTMGYETPGSFGSYAGVDRRIPTITLEMPHAMSGPSSWRQNREALLAFIRGSR